MYRVQSFHIFYAFKLVQNYADVFCRFIAK